MANNSAHVRNETAHESTHLHYGHFGTCVYDESVEEWSCLQHTVGSEQETSLLEFLHVENIDIDLGEATPHASNYATIFGSRQPRWLKQLEPTYRLLDDADGGAGAEPVLCLESIYCFAHGPYEKGSHMVLLPVVAYRTSLDSASLIVRSLRIAKSSDSNSALPMLGKGLSVMSAPSQDGILELTSSAAADYLALRQRSATSFCRIRVANQRHSDLTSTAFELECLIQIPIGRTGGHPHSHVVFDPWNSKRVGIVDIQGNWSIWRMEGKKKLSSKRLIFASLQASGALTPQLARSQSATSSQHMGWHRMCWLRNEASGLRLVLVCSRRSACLFDLAGSSYGDVDMRLGTRAAHHEILNIRSSEADRSACYVLTTTRVMVMQLANSGGNNRVSMDVLCSWTHFFSARHGALDMGIIEVDNARCIVVCNGRQEPRMFTLTTSSALGLVATGVQPLSIPSSLVNGCRLDLKSLKVVEVPPKRRLHSTTASQLFGKLVAINDNSKLLDLTFAVNAGQIGIRHNPQTEALYLQLAQEDEWRFKSSRYIDCGDDLVEFVVPDDLGLVSDTLPPPEATMYPTRSQASTKDWQDLLTEDTTFVSNGTELAASLHELDERAEKQSGEQRTRHAIAELVDNPNIMDVQEASEQLKSWTDQRVQDQGNPRHRILYQVPGSASTTLAATHCQLLTKFAEPTSRSLPDRARVQTERVAREVALDQCFSSIILQQLSTTAASSDAARAEPRTGQSNGCGVTDTELDPFATLRKYTNFVVPYVTSKSLATSSKILAHLPSKLNDPATYSYTEVERSLEEQKAEEELANLPENERRKVERDKLRREKRLAHLQRQQEVVSQDHRIPGLNTVDPREVQSSQLVPDETGSSQAVLVPMTQPERGPFGERKAAKGKSGKRAKGF